jgi:hypothetical protein
VNLTTITRVKAFKNVPSDDQTHDVELTRLIPAASKFCADYCERVFDGALSFVEYLSTTNGQTRIRVSRPPIRTIISLHDDPLRVYGADTLVDPTEYVVTDPKAGVIEFHGHALSDGFNNLKIVLDCGFLPLTAPAGPTVTPQGTPGATTYAYKLVAFDENGETEASAAGTTTTGNATLGSSNFNRLTWTAVAGAAGYRIYRTVGGATQGLLWTVYSGATLQFDDTAVTGDGSPAPTINTTGIPPDIEEAAIELSWLARDKGNLSMLGFRSKGVADGSYSTLDNEWPAGVKSILDSYCLPTVP